MGSKVSQPVRILALVGVLGTLALGAGFAMLGKSSGSSTPPKVIQALHGHLKGDATAKPDAHARVATQVAKPGLKAHAKTTAHKAAATPVAKAKRAAVAVQLPDNGLPAVVNQALLTHAVVVVSLYDPQALVDAASLGEAQAGAKLANAGFVPLNVLTEAEAQPLAKKLGVLPDPALLVFRRPGDLVFRVNGFADRATVAQAAANARP
jgi:hypothetical protein